MKQGKLLAIIKRNLSYIVVALCILAVGLSVIFVLLSQNQAGEFELNGEPTETTPTTTEPDTEPVVNPVETPEEKVVSFIMPVENAVEIEPFAETMAYNPTLKRYSSHLATDFFALEGTPVYAVYDGIVENVENSVLTGITVTIDHGNGLKTVYNSLEDADDVMINQTVKQGDIIGRVSSTNRQENSEGAHLHFEVVENGAKINPVKYLVIEEK